jgi:hypothetical protein
MLKLKPGAVLEKQESSGLHIAMGRVPEADSDKLYLGDPEAVRAIVDAYNSAIAEAVDAASDVGGMMPALRELAEGRADIFLGNGGDVYVPMPGWNSDDPEAIAANVARLYHIEPSHPAKDIVAAAFGMHAKAMLGAIADAGSGKPDTDWQADVDTANDLLVAALLGLPWPGAMDGEPHPQDDDG